MILNFENEKKLINNDLMQRINLKTGAVIYGSNWCPHCSHQKELFRAEAWSTVSYVECFTKGYYYDSKKVAAAKDKVEGFPAWRFPNTSKSKSKEWVSGEMPLERMILLSLIPGEFDVSLGGLEVADAIGSCR